MIKLTEAQKNIAKARVRLSDDEWNIADDCGVLAEALLKSKGDEQYDLVQNSEFALQDASNLLVRIDCEHLQQYVVCDDDNANAWFEAVGDDFGFQNAKEQLIKDLGL